MIDSQKVETVVRQHHGRLVAALASRFKDIALAEDALQEALVEALSKWTVQSWPANPPAWLMTVASRKAIDKLRRLNLHQTKVAQLALESEIDHQDVIGLEAGEHGMDAIPDHRLKLIFACCHPAIAEKNRSALILKTVCGLSTAQIASAWLVSEATMAQRLVRTKNKLAKAGIPFSVPEKSVMSARLDGVLEVIYLIFNAGYQAVNSKDLVDIELCDEALYLGKLLMTLLPGETEVIGLVSLMMFHQSRMDARVSGNGDLVAMADQERGLWRREDIATADKMLKGALMKGRPGAYQIQAAISAVHCHAISFEDTDWRQIMLLYYQLERYMPGPVVSVNLAVAMSFAECPKQALCYLDQLKDLEQLMSYYPYYVARADMLVRTGQKTDAAKLLKTAMSLTENMAEVRYLERKLAQLEL